MKNLTALNPAYLIAAGHDLLFQEFKEWKSDLEFFHNEINFFKKLVDKTFLHVTKKQETEMLEKLFKQMEQLDSKCLRLLDKVEKHETHLGKLEEKIFNKSDENVLDEHSKIKEDVDAFLTDMKKFKQNLFKSVEDIIHKEKFVIGKN